MNENARAELARLENRNVRLALDGLIRARYERARASFGVLGEAEAAMGDAAGEHGALMTRDVFTALYAPGTEVDIETDGTPVRRILDWTARELERLPEWRQLQVASRDNVIGSAIAAQAVVDHLADLDWPKAEDRTSTATRGGEKYEVRQDGNTVQIKRTLESGRTTNSTRRFGSAKAAEESAAETLRKMERDGFAVSRCKSEAEALEELAASLESDDMAGPMLRGRIAQDLRDAAEQAKQIEASVRIGYDLSEADGALRDPDEDAMKFADRLASSKQLADFMAHIGRFLDAMKDSRVRERVRGTVMPYDISTTRQFSRLLPAEVAMLALPATRSLQAARIISGQALGWQTVDIGSKGRGPMRIALDMSGSMQSWQTEAKAFAVAAALHAAECGRDASVVVFTTTVREIGPAAAEGPSRMRLIEDILRIVPSGGTDFRPLVRDCGDLPHGTDVLLISDGCGEIESDAARKAFENRALHYLVIGSEREVSPVLREIAGSNMVRADSIQDAGVVELAAAASAAS